MLTPKNKCKKLKEHSQNNWPMNDFLRHIKVQKVKYKNFLKNQNGHRRKTYVGVSMCVYV